MRQLLVGVTALILGTTVAACDNSSDTSLTLPSPTVINDVASGTVPPPVNGVPQSAFSPFKQSVQGTVAITLTSAIETFPDGTRLTTVTMGLGIGTLSGSTCTLIANAFTPAVGGASAQLSGTLAAGDYCVLVSDVTIQLGPVAYAVAIQHT